MIYTLWLKDEDVLEDILEVWAGFSGVVSFGAFDEIIIDIYVGY